jgi:hypothetical protein
MNPAAVNDDQAQLPAAERRRRNEGTRVAIIMATHIRPHRGAVNVAQYC